jgi:ATP dependent DNA ligase domain
MFQLTLRQAAEFLSKKDYTDNWPSEMNEEFCFWNFSIWKQVLTGIGLQIFENPNCPTEGSRVYANSWIVEHRHAGHVEVMDLQGQILSWPPTNMVLIAETADGVKRWRFSSSPSRKQVGKCRTDRRANKSIFMPDLQDGETVEMQGSGSKPYLLKNSGGVYSCSCPAWRNQSIAIEKRTCKHLRKLRGDAAEETRTGGALPQRPVKASGTDDGGSEEASGPPLLLAESWDNAADLSDWWMSEKLDGVRAYWDGKQFLSRQGNLYHAPDWFVEGLPSEPLDGELWIDRKKFQRTVSIVRRQDKNDLWNEVRFLVFDAPAATGGFEDRLAFLKDALAKGAAKFARQHPHERCKSLDALRAELTRIETLGGEGLMLRQPGSKYVAGRSATLLKVKTFHDAEPFDPNAELLR